MDFNAEERRLDLCNLYDFKIFVDTDFEVARERGAKREELAFGSYENTYVILDFVIPNPSNTRSRFSSVSSNAH